MRPNQMLKEAVAEEAQAQSAKVQTGQGGK